MLALIVIQTVVVVLLAILVVGLLRSHADILRALHELGVGLGDPSAADGEQGSAGAVGDGAGGQRHSLRLDPTRNGSAGAHRGEDRPDGPAPDLAGTTPSGDAVAYTLRGEHDTLLAFLSSGCTTCRAIWEALEVPDPTVPAGTRVLVVTGGPRDESPSRVAELAERVTVPVVASSEAWDAYQVPVSPYFVLVEGSSGAIAGEGAAGRWERVVEMVEQARADGDHDGARRTRAELLQDRVRRRRVEAMAADRDRERRIDEALLAAGIRPGDPRLHFEAGAHEEPDE